MQKGGFMTTFTIVLCMAVPVVAVYFFVWALLRAASLKGPIIPDSIEQCWNCGKQLGEHQDSAYCSVKCSEASQCEL
jgi:hypothetical protein